jgi:hypothetical protein
LENMPRPPFVSASCSASASEEASGRCGSERKTRKRAEDEEASGRYGSERKMRKRAEDAETRNFNKF